MKPLVDKMTVDEMIGLAAYTASLDPPGKTEPRATAR
jgi:hypothetical protein